MTRQERLRDFIARYPMHDPGSEPEADGRWLLIERNVSHGTPPYWLTTHDTPEAAADYHDGQEYVEDWTLVKLVDLDTGLAHAASPGRTTFDNVGNAHITITSELAVAVGEIAREHPDCALVINWPGGDEAEWAVTCNDGARDVGSYIVNDQTGVWA